MAFVLQAGFDPLGLVMGSSIYQIAPQIPRLPSGQPGCELVDMTRALYHARELAMNRMEEEATELGVRDPFDPRRGVDQAHQTRSARSR